MRPVRSSVRRLRLRQIVAEGFCLGRIGPWWRDIAQANDGIAILEFALVLPILLMTYIGTIEVANMMSKLRKLELYTQTIGDFVGSASVPSKAEFDGMLNAAKVVLMPFESSDLKVVVSAVGVVGPVASGPMQVCSSIASANAMPRPTAEKPPGALPVDQRAAGARMVLVETSLIYRPLTGSTFAAIFGSSLSSTTFVRQVYWPVRTGQRYYSQTPEIVLPNGQPCPPV